MAFEHGEHGALIVRAQVEQAVPGQNAGKVLVQGQTAHVGIDPLLLGKALATLIQQGGAAVDASDRVSMFEQIARYRLATATPQVQYLPASPHDLAKAFEPGLFAVKCLGVGPTRPVPSLGMTLVQIDDVTGGFVHPQASLCCSVAADYSTRAPGKAKLAVLRYVAWPLASQATGAWPRN